MAEIQTKCGAVVFVDEDIAKEQGHFVWRIDKFGYVFRKTTIHGRHGRTVLLHRVVLGCSDSCVLVDHLDMNPLNNMRQNLRLATVSQNGQNRLKAAGRSSIYKGVTWHKAANKWQVRAQIRSKRLYLGLFDCEHEAGHAYNRAAIKLHGEFARLNPVGFPKDAP